MNEAEKLEEWFGDDRAALGLIELIFEASQIADDFVDGDKPQNKNSEMCRLLHICLVDIPANQAFQQVGAWLWPLLSSSIIQWGASNVNATHENEDVRRFSWAMRDITEQIISQLILVRRGYFHAAAVAPEIARYFRMNEDGETFEEWQGSINK